MDDFNANADRETLKKQYLVLIEEYLKETKSPATPSEFTQQLAISPIKIGSELAGFWGLTFQNSKAGQVATIKAFYLREHFRGPAINSITDDLIRGLTAKGIKFMEVWAFPDVQKWLTHRYGITPRINVNYDPIETYQVYDKPKK